MQQSITKGGEKVACLSAKTRSLASEAKFYKENSEEVSNQIIIVLSLMLNIQNWV